MSNRTCSVVAFVLFLCRCFAVDRSGFVIVHQDFLDNPPSAQVHITTKEPQIAADMVKRGIMTNDSCVNYADITDQRFYMVLQYSHDNADTSITITETLIYIEDEPEWTIF